MDDILEDYVGIDAASNELLRRVHDRALPALTARHPTTYNTAVHHDHPNLQTLSWSIKDPRNPYRYTQEQQGTYDKTHSDFEKYMQAATELAMMKMLENHTVLTAGTLENVKEEVDGQLHFTAHALAGKSLLRNKSHHIIRLRCERQGTSSTCPVVRSIGNREFSQTFRNEMERVSSDIWNYTRGRVTEGSYLSPEKRTRLIGLAFEQPDFFTKVSDWEPGN